MEYALYIKVHLTINTHITKSVMIPLVTISKNVLKEFHDRRVLTQINLGVEVYKIHRIIMILKINPAQARLLTGFGGRLIKEISSGSVHHDITEQLGIAPAGIFEIGVDFSSYEIHYYFN